MTNPATVTTSPIHHRTRLARSAETTYAAIPQVIRAEVGVDLGHRNLQLRVPLVNAARQLAPTAIAQAVLCEASVAIDPQPGSRLSRPLAASGSSGAFPMTARTTSGSQRCRPGPMAIRGDTPMTAGTGAAANVVDRALRRFEGTRP